MRTELLKFEEREALESWVRQFNQMDASQYSLRRGLLSQAGEASAPLEQEVSRECQRILKFTGRGLVVPTGMAWGRALSTGGGAGGETIFTQPKPLIEMLRNAMHCTRLGGRLVSGLVGPVNFPRQLTPGGLEWRSETPGSDVSDTDMSFDLVPLSPKSAQSTTAYSRQLLAQSSVDVEALVRADLVAVNAQGIDKAAIQGLGSANQPKGILKTTGIGDVPIGTDGGYPTGDHLQALETLLYAGNVGTDSLGWMVTPGVRGYFRKTLRLAGSSVPIFVWEENRADELRGYKAFASNNVPSTLTKGSKNDCHAIILGNWSDLMIGEWGVIEIIVDPYRLKKQGVIEVTSFVMVDVAVRHPVAFAAIQDARIVA